MLLSPDKIREWGHPPAGDASGIIADAQRWVEGALHLGGVLEQYDARLIPTGSTMRGTNTRNSDADFTLTTSGVSPDDLGRVSTLVARALSAASPRTLIEISNKCVNVDHCTSIPPTDIMPCIPTAVRTPRGPVPAIILRTRQGEAITSYPDLHCDRLNDVFELTGGGVVRLVRAAKRMRDWLAAEGAAAPTTASSYHIESAAMEFPPDRYTGDLARDVIALTEMGMLALSKKGKALRAGNGVYELFGNGPLQWGPQDALNFFRSMQIALPEIYPRANTRLWYDRRRYDGQKQAQAFDRPAMFA